MHYDLRLECDGVLKSWAVPKGLSLDPNDKRLAAQTEDHPYDYASFEGVIPTGQYGAGEMIVWDCGVYSPDEDQQYWFHDRAAAEQRVREGLDKGKLSFILRGEKLKGSFALVRMADRKNWLVIKHKDRYVSKSDVTEQDRSVLSGLTVQDLKTLPVPPRVSIATLIPTGEVEAMPATLAPMHADLARCSVQPSGLDVGTEARRLSRPGLYRKREGQAAHAARTRSGRRLSKAVRRARQAGGRQHDPRRRDRGVRRRRQAVVQRDAEPRQRSSRIARDQRRVFYAFDMPHFAGLDLRKAPYSDRRRYLAQCLLPSPLVQLVHGADDGVALHEAAVASGFEGVVGKRKDSRYEGGQAHVGVGQGQGDHERASSSSAATRAARASRAPLGAVLVGYLGGQQAALCVARGLGLRRQHAAGDQGAARAAARAKCPFATKPELHSPTTWVEPEIVAEVSFQSWTDDGSSARAGVPAPARRPRSEDDPAREPGSASADRAAHPPAAARSTTSCSSSTTSKSGIHARGRDRTRSGSPTSIASTGRPIRR